MCHLSPASRTVSGTKQACNAFLKESDVDWSGSGTTAEGFLYEVRLSTYVADTTEFASTPGKEKEMLMFPFPPETVPGPRRITLACWTLGVRERSRTGGWLAVLVFGRGRKAVQWVDGWFHLPNCQCVEGDSSGNCLVKLFHSTFPHHILSKCQHFGQNGKFCGKKIDYFCYKASVFHEMTECPRDKTCRSYFNSKFRSDVPFHMAPSKKWWQKRKNMLLHIDEWK